MTFARNGMRISLLQPLIGVPIAVVDTETTGASAALGHKVIEIGIVRIERGQIVARYEQLVDPGRPISPGVSYLTGITQAMVDGQPRFKDRLPEIMQLFQGAAILGHNIRFDLSFLHAECRRAGADLCQSLGDIPVFDTVRIARKRHGRGGNSLPVLSRRLGVDPVVSHRALADALTTAGVFNKLLEPVGGYNLTVCDTFVQQGGPIDLARSGSANLLPLELEEALEAQKPVLMEYLDARGARTHRAIKPLHVRRVKGELLLVAHCHLRDDRRTFKLDRIVRLTRTEEGATPQSLEASIEACAAPDETAFSEPQLFDQ